MQRRAPIAVGTFFALMGSSLTGLRRRQIMYLSPVPRITQPTFVEVSERTGWDISVAPLSKLSGSMHAGIFDTFDGIIMDFGKYDFTQTVYSSGSTTFSGKFVVPGLPNADSSFAGVLTGPGAAEPMARFQAPYLFNGQQGTMFGVWVGKKD